MMTGRPDCREIVYHEPTPMWYHSYGLDSDGKLRRSDELATPREERLRGVLPETPQLWELRNQAEKVTPDITVGRCVMDVKDVAHHSWPYQTEKSSQVIGSFADPKKLPRCMLREWPKHYRIV